jgi:TRAP-type C4-dicarboxylate transport system permease small subunit
MSARGGISARTLRIAWWIVLALTVVLLVSAFGLALTQWHGFMYTGPWSMALLFLALPIAVILTGVRGVQVSARQRAAKREAEQLRARADAAMDPQIAEMRQDYRPPRWTRRPR